MREALFSLVGQHLAGQRVLDACGGTGLMAFEAASRGADVVVVERSPARARWIAEVAGRLALRVRAIPGDSGQLPPNLGRFDGIYLDPPYADDPGPLLSALAERCDGWVALESRATTPSPPTPEGFLAEPLRRYGEACLRLYRRAS